ncbi:MAG: DUF116 domain-containing protein [Nitrospirae bacterium]|nr:DUF116 domain-containing protein [Nitrospirota bacterium]
MSEEKEKYKPVTGKTYTLFGPNAGTVEYYSIIKKLTDLFLQKCPDANKLLFQVQKAGARTSFINLSARRTDRPLIFFIKDTLKNSLSSFTLGVAQHLGNLSLPDRFDSTLNTTEEQYHLYMIEIELFNRINKEKFKSCEYKFALIPHCLRDFRPDCKSVPGHVEAVCRECAGGCFIRLGGLLLKKYNIDPYISMTTDLKKLFRKLKSGHASIGALGIACIPELVSGMRLCMKMNIPAVGIPLDANRCARWTGSAKESSFNLDMLEDLIK